MTIIVRRRPSTPGHGEQATSTPEKRPPVRRRRACLVMAEDAGSPQDADLSDDAGSPAVPMIPVIDEGVGVCGAALAYAAAGLYVLPIDARTKNAGSVLRGGWPSKSSRDPQQIVSWFAATNHGLAVHLGPSGLMAFDVDNPGQLPAVLTELFTTSDPPFQSTRTGQPGRGHFLFRVPPGRSFGNSLGGLPAGWGDVRGCNGIIVVAPTMHSRAEEGGCYRWKSAGTIPELPSTIADLLTDAMSTDEAATDAQVQDFLVTHTEGSDPGRLRPIVERYQTMVGTGASRHHTLVGCLIRGCKEVLAGNISARRMTSELRAVHLAALADPHHPNGAAPSRGDFDDVLRWALAQARTDPLSDTTSSIHPAAVPPHRAQRPRKMQSTSGGAETGDCADSAEVSTEFDTSVPTPLDRGSMLPDFPVDVLPRVVANMVREVAKATQTDPGMSGAVALGVMATAVGGDVEVHVTTGYFEPTNLFVAVVARPGERKSAVCTAMTAPLVDLERELVQNTRSLIIQQQMRKDIAERHAEEAKKTAGTADAANRADTTTEAVAAAQHADDIMVAAVPQIIADDITLEALGQRLAAQGGRLAIVSPEGGFLATAAGRYKSNPDLSIPLKAHAGDRLRVDRINRGTDFVEKPALTVVMMVQPGVLAEASRNNSRFHDSGLFPRFLFAVPPSRLGHRDVNSPGLNPATTAAYRAHVIAIARDSRPATDRHVLTLDAAAHVALREFDRRVEARLGPAGELAHLSGWAGKLVGATVRIAGLIHAFSRETEGAPITVESMCGAIKLAEYFTAHALCAFEVMAGRDTDLEPARRVVGLIGRNPTFPEFTSRDLFTAASRSWMPNMESMNSALGKLIDYGWIVPLPEPVRSDGTRGRPPSPRYRAHPRCHQEAPRNPHN